MSVDKRKKKKLRSERKTNKTLLFADEMILRQKAQKNQLKKNPYFQK